MLASNASIVVDVSNSTDAAALSPLGVLCTPYFSLSLLESPFVRWSLPLQPYWMTFLSSLIMLLLPFVWNRFLVPLFDACVRCLSCGKVSGRPRSDPLPGTLLTPTAGLMAAQLHTHLAAAAAWRSVRHPVSAWQAHAGKRCACSSVVHKLKRALPVALPTEMS